MSVRSSTPRYKTTFLSARVVFDRVVELMNDPSLPLPKAPLPTNGFIPKPVKYDRFGRKMKQSPPYRFGSKANPVILFGPVKRPLFVIDEAELPY